jgi:hypothetical protein
MEETPSPLLGGEQRIHHVYLCRLQLTFCKNNLLAVCLHSPIQQVEMGPSVLAAMKSKYSISLLQTEVYRYKDVGRKSCFTGLSGCSVICA